MRLTFVCLRDQECHLQAQAALFSLVRIVKQASDSSTARTWRVHAQRSNERSVLVHQLKHRTRTDILLCGNLGGKSFGLAGGKASLFAHIIPNLPEGLLYKLKGTLQMTRVSLTSVCEGPPGCLWPQQSSQVQKCGLPCVCHRGLV